ncbi:MAG: class I mannose-6-phosphate isomerase [Akkermansiaceae bacterium]
MKTSNYDKFPVVAVPDSSGDCVTGWEAITATLFGFIRARHERKTIVVVECYPGVHEEQLLEALATSLRPVLALQASDGMLPPDSIETLVAPFLGGDDPVFGYLSPLELPSFFDAGRVARLRALIESAAQGLVVVVGCGARLIHAGDVLVYADLARWEAQLRFRRNECGNLGTANHTFAASLQYKRAFFVDWRVADRWKRPLIAEWDFALDTHDPLKPKLATGDALRRGLRHTVTRPFRVVPFFDPAPWGGQWMKDVCDLDRSVPNYGWCFDCVPEENSLLLEFGGIRFEIPAINLVFDQPQSLLGNEVFARFGAEFPIRFDLLDTMDGGNLSFQVHPLVEYIREKFGMAYTQDESYYLLDSGADAKVVLGLRDGVDPAAMLRDLELAAAGGASFPAEKYANFWPTKMHDHFLIPAGMVHCCGANSMVLEISATPYIFTCKLWDWGRLGLDGKPRPIHLKHGASNIRRDRTTEWIRRNLINRFQPLSTGNGWREERTGLHDSHFIETRRHWFTKQVPHHTNGGVNVLNLVAGDRALVESPDGMFDPYEVHYAETFVVPAAVGAYTVRSVANRAAEELATIKASVRS